jgi:formylglycine-generating enzyme required for sulfatase activity
MRSLRINGSTCRLRGQGNGRVTAPKPARWRPWVSSKDGIRALRFALSLMVAAMLTAISPVRAEQLQELRDCATCPVLVEVPAGTFVRMDRLGGPEFPVRFDRPYALGKYTVTRAEFAVFVEATGHQASGCTIWQTFGSRQDPQMDWRRPGFEPAPDEPVVCVSWHDAQAYIDWLRQKTGEPYRLPSEAEWEYAARAGAVPDGAYRLRAGLKPGGANCADCGGVGMMGREDILSTKPVGTYEPNAFGLHEMLGNVAQWVADCANPSFAGAPQDGSAWLEGDCAKRISRGGTWHSNWNELASYREAIQPDQRRNDTGFRVAKTLR